MGSEVASVAANAPQRVPWGWGAGAGAVLLAFAIETLAAIAIQLLAGARQTASLGLAILAYQFLALGVLLAAVVLIFSRYHAGPRLLGFRYPGWRSLTGAAVSLVPILIGVAAIQSLFNSFIPGYGVHGNSQELLQGGSSNVNWLQEAGLALWAAVEAPLVEETLFRGMLFQGLRDSCANVLPYRLAVLVAATLSGLAFGLLHFQPHTLPILVFLGIALAYIFQTTNSVYASALVHGMSNFLAVISTFHPHS